MPNDAAPAIGQAAYQHNGTLVSAEHFYAVACDPRRNVAVEACAGAGKTWMLVSRILRALLDGLATGDGTQAVAPHEILAITFTKRAAGEMRERLYQWLDAFAHAPPDALLRELETRGVRLPAGDEGRQAAAQRLAGLYSAVLQSGRQVQIRTFHSWFAALLRAAPLAMLEQLGLPVDYELLEDDSEAVRQVWRRFYQALLADPEGKADYAALVLAHGRSQTTKALQGALDKRVEFQLADAQGVVDVSVQHFSALFPTLAGLNEPAAALCQEGVPQRWLVWARALGQESNKTPQKAAQAMLEAFSTPEGADAEAALPAPVHRLMALRKALFVATEDRLTQHLKKYPAAQEAEAELMLLCAAHHQHQAWLYHQRMARLSRILIAEYAALKRTRGWIDMSDVERTAGALLSDPVLSGWVQERLDARVRHLLIDEFQDTNPLQWQALSSWLGSYAGAGGRAPSVFLVGDPKQSIYRFRRAEPQVFRAAQAFVAEGLAGDLLSCDHTRRNAHAVIDTVNAVMLEASERDGFDGFRPHTTSADDAGLVGHLPAIPRPGRAGAGADAQDGIAWRDSLTTAREEPEETLRSLEAAQVAAWIAGELSLGDRTPQDVMVMSRKRAGLLPMQEALRALGIPARIGEKTALIDCCEVQDVVALLDVLVSPQHDLSLARALRSPLFGLADEALVEIALRKRADPRPWFALLQQHWPQDSALQGVGAVLLRWRVWLDQLPPHDALQAIYDDGDVLARFAIAAPAAQRDVVLANLRALLAASLELAGGRYATPYGFVRALKAGGVHAPAVSQDNAVRLLTVHGAKGLEAGIVVLLDTDTPERAAETMGVLVDWPGQAAHPAKLVFLASESAPPACCATLLATEMEQRRREEINGLYVALTRARHSLMLSSVEPHRDAPHSWWQRVAGRVPLCLPPEASVATAAVHGAAASTDNSFVLKVVPTLTRESLLAWSEGRDDGVEAASASDAVAPGQPESVAARKGKAMHRLLEWGAASERHVHAVGREFALDAEQVLAAAEGARRIQAGQGAWVWDTAVVDWQGAEVELVFQGELHRLDRLVRRRDTGHWWVLDFKSAAAPQRQGALMVQLRNYRRAVQQMYPESVVRAAFLTAEGALLELPEGLDP